MNTEGKERKTTTTYRSEIDCLEDDNYDPEIIVPKMRRIVRNTKEGMIAYINLQRCSLRNAGNSIIDSASNLTSDDFLRELSGG